MNTQQTKDTNPAAACPPLSVGLCGNDRLPDGKTCIQCANYDHGLKCHWEIGVCCENTLCQWAESRFMPHNGIHGQRAIWKVKKMDELHALCVTF